MVDVRRALGALACVLALVGCTTDAPAGPGPSPSSAVQTPPETAQERQQRLDYAAAEKSYRTFRAEYNRVLRAGGAKEPTKVMKATAGGDYLDTFSAAVRGYKKLGARDSGLEKVVYVKPGGYDPKAILLKVCEDSRGVVTVRKSGKGEHGEVLALDLTIKQTEGAWKVWDGTGGAVNSCA